MQRLVAEQLAEHGVSMAKHLLTARQVQTLDVGDHSDGDGLVLRVQAGTDKLPRASWVLRYTSPGGKRQRELGLGSADRSSQEAAGASLKRARKKADDARDLLDKSIDPIDAKRARKHAAREKDAADKAAKKSDATTLLRYARAYHEEHVEPLLVDRHAKEWIAAIERHLPTVLLDKPLAAGTATNLLDALVPILRQVSDTGPKIYQRLTRIFDAAVIAGLRPDNPAVPIRKELRKRAGHRQSTNHASMPHRPMTTFIADLRGQGHRLGAVDALQSQGGVSLVPSLAGQAMNSWMPRGMLGHIEGGLGPLAAILHPTAIPKLVGGAVIGSPRLVGEGAYALGRAAGGVNSASAALTRIPVLPATVRGAVLSSLTGLRAPQPVESLYGQPRN
jgi:Arm domain-containing DNA-binding protein/integrase-like protein